MSVKPTFDDIGDIFDYLLIGRISELYQAESLFLLQYNNYTRNYSDIKEQVTALRSNPIKNKVKGFILKKSGTDAFNKGQCRYSISRKKNKQYSL